MNVKEDLLRCKEWIQSALDKGGDTHSFIDVVEGVLSGHMQLWSGEKGCAVTEIVCYPNKKVLHVFLAGGKLEQISKNIDKGLFFTFEPQKIDQKAIFWNFYV